MKAMARREFGAPLVLAGVPVPKRATGVDSGFHKWVEPAGVTIQTGLVVPARSRPNDPRPENS